MEFIAPKNGVEDLDTTIDPSTISNNRDLELATEDSQVNTSTYPRTPLAGPTLDDSSIRSNPNKIEEFEPDVDFADTPYQEQSEISKTFNQQEDEEIDFSDSPANLDIEEEGFLLDSDPAVIWPKLLKQIKHEKDKRRHEILVLERKKKYLTSAKIRSIMTWNNLNTQD